MFLSFHCRTKQQENLCFWNHLNLKEMKYWKEWILLLLLQLSPPPSVAFDAATTEESTASRELDMPCMVKEDYRYDAVETISEMNIEDVVPNVSMMFDMDQGP